MLSSAPCRQHNDNLLGMLVNTAGGELKRPVKCATTHILTQSSRKEPFFLFCFVFPPFDVAIVNHYHYSATPDS